MTLWLAGWGPTRSRFRKPRVYSKHRFNGGNSKYRESQILRESRARKHNNEGWCDKGQKETICTVYTHQVMKQVIWWNIADTNWFYETKAEKPKKEMTKIKIKIKVKHKWTACDAKGAKLKHKWSSKLKQNHNCSQKPQTVGPKPRRWHRHCWASAVCCI